MKTVFYLVRHGESQANRARVFAGHTDIDLTEFGERQAEATAEYLRDIPTDRIYASDLLRAFHTGCATARRKGMEITPEPRLREIFAGEWEGKRCEDLPTLFPDDYRTWLTNIGHSVCTGGESVADLQTRIVACLRELAERNPGKTLFLFTHATPIRVLKAACDGIDADHLKDIPWAPNASVTRIECDGGRLVCTGYGYDRHLNNLRITPPEDD